MYMLKPVKKGKEIMSKNLDSVTYWVKKFGQIWGGRAPYFLIFIWV